MIQPFALVDVFNYVNKSERLFCFPNEVRRKKMIKTLHDICTQLLKMLGLREEIHIKPSTLPKVIRVWYSETSFVDYSIN